MKDTGLPSKANQPGCQSVWKAAWVVSIFLAIAGLALVGVILNDIFEGNVAARTVWGILIMATGVIALFTPFVVASAKCRFSALPRPLQWLLTTMLPMSFIVLAAIFFVCAHRSVNVFVPFTPTLTILFQADPSKPMLDVSLRHGARQSGGHSSSSGSAPGEIEVEPHQFSAWSADVHGQNKKTVATLSGQTTVRSSGSRVEIVSNLELKEPMRLVIEGLKNVTLATNERQAGVPATLEAGTYKLVIGGIPAGKQ